MILSNRDWNIRNYYFLQWSWTSCWSSSWIYRHRHSC